MEALSLKTIALKLKRDLMGTLQNIVTRFPQPLPQPSPLTQPISTHTNILEHQMSIQLETWESMITESKALAKYVSSNTKGK